MKGAIREVDSYIDSAAPFAQPILRKAAQLEVREVSRPRLADRMPRGAGTVS